MKAIIIFLIAVSISFGSTSTTLNPGNFKFSESIKLRTVNAVLKYERQIDNHTFSTDRQYRREGLSLALNRISINSAINPKLELYTRVMYKAIVSGNTDAILIKYKKRF